MRRWLTVFLAAFIPQMGVMAYFSWRAQAPKGSQDDQPLVSVSKQGLPPKGTQAATGVAIRVYEGDRMIAEISGTEAQFVGSDSAVFREAVIRAWPEQKGRFEHQPAEVFIRADRAEIERGGFTARVTGNVQIDSSDGDHLRAQDLNIRFGKRETGGDGKEVVDHSEKTVDTDGIVELTGNDRRLKGRGFHGNLALKSFRFDHDVEGTFFGTSADFDTTAATRSARKPEDVTFSAGGPVNGDPLPPDGNAQRTRLTMAGGVNVLRIDASTEKPSRLRCAVLVLDVRRETTPAPVSLVAWDGVAELVRAMGMSPVRPAPIADVRPTPPKLRLERLTAEGGVTVDDPRVDLVCDSLETTNAADGSGVTTIRGVRKQVVFKERGALSLGPMGGGTGGAEKTGPVEVTAMDDIRIIRSPDGEGGTPGPATVSLSRWVSVREGARSLTCDALRIDLTPDAAAKEGAGYAASALAAKGNVLIEEPGRSARADTLDWDAASDTVTLRSDAGAEVADAKSRLLAKTIAFDNKTGRVSCTGNVVAKGEGGGLAPASLIELNPSRAKGGGKWELHCPAFSGTLSKGELQSLDAEGPVEIISDSTHAFSDSLHFAEGTAILTGRPARIVAGDDVVEASEIALSPDSGRAVLRGVKQMRIHLKGGLKGLSGLAPAARNVPAGVDAVPTPVTLTCTGPVVIDRNAGIFVARDGVLLRAPETAPAPGAPPPPESRLEAERFWIHFEPQTREVLGALATGRVRIRSSGSIAAGDRLTYDVPTGTASLTGVGLASFSGNGLVMRVAEILVSDGGHTLKFLPRGSKGSISFPDGGSGERRPDDFLRNPFGDLRPKPK